MYRTYPLLVVALSLVVTLIPTGYARGAAAGGGTLYFQRGAYIYAANADGSDARQATHTGTAASPDTWPAVSPDGRQIAYTQGRSPHLYIASTAGGAPRFIASDCEHPAWSADNSQIACDRPYLFEGRTDQAVVVYAAATGKALTILDVVGQARLAPTWSPDNHTVVMSQYTATGPDAGSYILSVLNTATREVYALTDDSAHDYLYPVLSPDGSLIAYVRAATGQSGGSLWVMNADGSRAHRVAAGTDRARPAWSSDDATVAFGWQGAVYSVPAAGGSMTRLETNASHPAWSAGASSTPTARYTYPSFGLDKAVSFVENGAQPLQTDHVKVGQSLYFLVQYHAPKNAALRGSIRYVLNQNKGATVLTTQTMKKTALAGGSVFVGAFELPANAVDKVLGRGSVAVFSAQMIVRWGHFHGALSQLFYVDR